MKMWCSLFVVALLVSSSASADGRLAALFAKLNPVSASKSSGLLTKAAGLFTAGFIACTGLSCDTQTVIKITEQVHTEREVHVSYNYQQMYYVINDVAWPYHVVDMPDYGYPEVVDYDCDYIPMEVMYGNAVSDHDYIGDDIAYLSPPPGGGDPYYNYGKVKKYYGNGFYEVEVSSWSESYSYTERTTLTRTYTVLIDASLNADNGGVFLDIGVLE